MCSPTEDCVYMALKRLARRVAHHFDAALAKAGLKTTQLDLLSEILRLQPVCPGKLAQALNLDPSTLTRNLRPLIAAGWVELGAGKDARSRHVRVTARGRVKKMQAQRLLIAARQAMGDRLGLRRMAELEALMNESLDILTSVR